MVGALSIMLRLNVIQKKIESCGKDVRQKIPTVRCVEAIVEADEVEEYKRLGNNKHHF